MDLETYKKRLFDADWEVEPGGSLSPQPLTDLKILWMARKNGVLVIVSDKAVRVVRGSAHCTTPIEVVQSGHLLVPGHIAEKYPVGSMYCPGDLVAHEGPMTDEERELKTLLQA